tara:strand:- start:125 stop:613 length:489 start_codon:yes stop_codon:yes gene_type:complete
MYILFNSTRLRKYTGKNGVSFSKVGEVQLIEDEDICKYLLTEQPSMFSEVSGPDAVQVKETTPIIPVEEPVIAPPMLEDNIDMIRVEMLDSGKSENIEVAEDIGSAIELEFSNVLSSHDEAMSLKEIAEVMGVSTQKIIAVSKRLIDQKKVSKVGNEYQLIT